MPEMISTVSNELLINCKSWAVPSYEISNQILESITKLKDFI